MSVESVLNDMCKTCEGDIGAIFGASPRPGPVIIAGDRHHSKCCFVADVVIFNKGKLIFDPVIDANGSREYCQTYYLVCRKLIVIGGGEPLPIGICDTEDPGTSYKNKNVITWKDRLIAAAPGVPHAGAAADATDDWDRNAWDGNVAPSNDGLDGGPGATGSAGNPATAGLRAPNFALICLEVEFQELNGHLTIDFDGQVGGAGGRGQDGGEGGKGMGGRRSESDNTWPGKGCDRTAGNGGDGGDHGDGGPGGLGGKGGDAGDIAIVSGAAHVSAGGAFLSGKLTYVNDGGNEGPGGLGGFGAPPNSTPLAKGGRGGAGGPQCGPGIDGDEGGSGWPPFEVLGGGSSVNPGAAGAPGAAGLIEPFEIISAPCTDPIPVDSELFNADPAVICRGFNSPSNNVSLTLDGANLAQTTDVEFSLGGVSASILPTSDDSTLNLLVDVTGASGTGPCDIILKRDFGGDQVFSGLLDINRFELLAILPNTGARDSIVEVTLQGTCFDPSALVQNVDVSGVGVSVGAVVVVNSTTVTAEFDISNSAAPTNRDITLVIGTNSHTLPGAFNVTL